MAGRIFLAIACICLLAACGNTSTSASSTSVTTAPPPAVTTSAAPAQATATPVAAPGCGTYCQQAGESAGSSVVGYPCPQSGCLRCPAQNCVTLGSSGTTVANGVAAVQLSCNLSAECEGAILFCLPVNHFCESGPTVQAAGGRIAGSDFVVAAGTTSNVPVGLTALGEQVVSTNSGGFSVTVLVDMRDYGNVLDTSTSQTGLTLTSNDPPTYPSGATAGCGGVLFVGPGTSCPFAQNVEQAYSNSVTSGNGTVTAVSPVTGDTYQMQCTGGSPVVCMGGTNAIVEFYT